MNYNRASLTPTPSTTLPPIHPDPVPDPVPLNLANCSSSSLTCAPPPTVSEGTIYSGGTVGPVVPAEEITLPAENTPHPAATRQHKNSEFPTPGTPGTYFSDKVLDRESREAEGGDVALIGQTKEDCWAQSFRLLTEMFLAAETRGRDATGFVGLTDSLENSVNQKVIMDKAPLKSTTFVKTNPSWRNLKRNRCSMVLGHVRAATHGDPNEGENINNHPHGSHPFYLVHNGIVPRFKEIADRYSVTLQSHCDSEVLLRVIESSANPAEGMVACLREEPGAIGLFDAKHKKLYLGRSNDRPLWICRLRKDRRIIFASTADIILTALRVSLGKEALEQIEMLMPLAPYFVYALTPDGTISSVYSSEIRPAKVRSISIDD